MLLFLVQILYDSLRYLLKKIGSVTVIGCSKGDLRVTAAEGTRALRAPKYCLVFNEIIIQYPFPVSLRPDGMHCAALSWNGVSNCHASQQLSS